MNTEIPMGQQDIEWRTRPWLEGFDAAVAHIKQRLIEYGGDKDGNIPLQVVFDIIKDI